MRSTLILILWYLISAMALATDVQPTSVGEFEVDTNLVEKLYLEKTESEINRSFFDSAKISAQISFAKINSFSLKNNYFTVDYGSQKTTLPFFIVQFYPISKKIGPFDFSLDLSLGYSYVEDIYDTTTKTNLAVRDSIQLQWIPISAAIFVSYNTGFFVEPYAALGIGQQYIRQSGSLDGITQSYWIPFTTASLGLTWFGDPSSAVGGFSGLNTGVSFIQSSNRKQKIDLLTMDLGVNFLM